MAFATKLTEATDKNDNTYFWGYLKLGFFNIKVTLFKHKTEEEKWNLNFEEKIEEKHVGENDYNNKSAAVPKEVQEVPKETTQSDIPF